MTFIDLSTATWPEAGDAFRRGLIVVLPVGAQEQHGAHLPLATDTTLAAGVARRLAIAIGGGLLPAIPYGEAASAEGWPGTLSLSAATLEAVVLDIGRGVKRMGATALVTLNGHFGNRAPIERAAVALRDEGLPVLTLDYPRLEALAVEICESEPAGPGFYHADEVETSMHLALDPGGARMDRAAPEYPVFPADFGTRPVPLHTFNSSGVFGDPRPATADKGERLISGIVDEAVRLVREFTATPGSR